MKSSSARTALDNSCQPDRFLCSSSSQLTSPQNIQALQNVVVLHLKSLTAGGATSIDLPSITGAGIGTSRQSSERLDCIAPSYSVESLESYSDNKAFGQDIRLLTVAWRYWSRAYWFLRLVPSVVHENPVVTSGDDGKEGGGIGKEDIISRVN
jgi:hypothetical protein